MKVTDSHSGRLAFSPWQTIWVETRNVRPKQKEGPQCLKVRAGHLIVLEKEEHPQITEPKTRGKGPPQRRNGRTQSQQHSRWEQLVRTGRACGGPSRMPGVTPKGGRHACSGGPSMGWGQQVAQKTRGRGWGREWVVGADSVKWLSWTSCGSIHMCSRGGPQSRACGTGRGDLPSSLLGAGLWRPRGCRQVKPRAHSKPLIRSLALAAAVWAAGKTRKEFISRWQLQ